MRTLRNTFGKLDLMVSFAKDNLITEKMAYGNCSYEVEKRGVTPLFKKLYDKTERATKARMRQQTPRMGILRD
jgi:hypothetical protein